MKHNFRKELVFVVFAIILGFTINTYFAEAADSNSNLSPNNTTIIIKGIDNINNIT